MLQVKAAGGKRPSSLVVSEAISWQGQQRVLVLHLEQELQLMVSAEINMKSIGSGCKTAQSIVNSCISVFTCCLQAVSEPEK